MFKYSPIMTQNRNQIEADRQEREIGILGYWDWWSFRRVRQERLMYNLIGY